MSTPDIPDLLHAVPMACYDLEIANGSTNLVNPPAPHIVPRVDRR